MLSPFFVSSPIIVDPFFAPQVVYRRPIGSRLAYSLAPTPSSFIDEFLFNDSLMVPAASSLLFAQQPKKQLKQQKQAARQANKQCQESNSCCNANNSCQKVAQVEQENKASSNPMSATSGQSNATSVATPATKTNNNWLFSVPQFNVKRTDNEMEFTIASSDAQVAPLQRENLKIELDEEKHVLSISGSHTIVEKDESSSNGEASPKFKSVHKFVKSFSVPSSVKAEDIAAKWSDNQLTVKVQLPQKPKKNVKQIQVVTTESEPVAPKASEAPVAASEPEPAAPVSAGKEESTSNTTAASATQVQSSSAAPTVEEDSKKTE